MASGAITWREFEQIACLDGGPYHLYLGHQYRLVADDLILKQTVQEILRSNRTSNELAALRLERAGLVRSKNGGYILRRELYGQLFCWKFVMAIGDTAQNFFVTGWGPTPRCALLRRTPR